VIPYAWFEKDGPVLYINRSKWPFPTSFNVTSSDRTDLSLKNLTPRQSHWMPYIKYQDFVPVRGAVLHPSVMLWVGQSQECLQFRVETIKWIQDQLESSTRAISTATIGAIMTFTMWTVSSLSPNMSVPALVSAIHSTPIMDNV
jgi:hypothetical protein